MTSERESLFLYLREQFETHLDEWEENRNGHSTFTLGWSIIQFEEFIRRNGFDGGDVPVYPKEFFSHLHTMDGQTLKSLPAEITESAMHIERSLPRHYGLTRAIPVVIFNEDCGQGPKIVAYFGANR